MIELMIVGFLCSTAGFWCGIYTSKGLLHVAKQKLREATEDREMAKGFHEASREFANAVKALTKVMEARLDD